MSLTKQQMRDVWEVLEATAVGKHRNTTTRVATKGDSILHRNHLMDFLIQIDGDLTVDELGLILTEYTGD